MTTGMSHMSYVYIRSNRTGATSGTGTTYPCECWWSSCCSIVDLVCGIFQIGVCPLIFDYCRSFDLLILINYPFSLFKHFLINMILHALWSTYDISQNMVTVLFLLWSACSVDDSPVKLEPANFDHVVVILLILLITYSSCQQVRFLVYFNLSNI